jgi:YidC/Oxa1 family membrane protein insertase
MPPRVAAGSDTLRGILDPIIDLLFAILSFIHDTGLNWGWSIVVLTIVVRIALLPLTYKQMKSMRALQALQPAMKELQEKYRNDRQLMQQKTMEFYQENKINPFGSCLPLLLQMPVFFALFYMLQDAERAGEFAVDNTWLWIRDWGSNPSWLAENITQFDLLLLLLYVASQFLASMQMTTKDPTQRAMMLGMPVVIGIIMFVGKWPAGLFIYWFTSNLWTIAQQSVVSKVFPAPVPVVSGGTSSGPTKQRKKAKAKSSKR